MCHKVEECDRGYNYCADNVRSSIGFAVSDPIVAKLETYFRFYQWAKND